MWKSIRENPRAVTYAVLMHLVLLVLLMVGLDWTPKAIKPGVKIPIEAELVSSDKLKVLEQRKLEAEKAAEQQRKQAEADKAAAEKKKQAEVAAQKKAAAEKVKQAELAAKKKADAEKKAVAEKKKQAEVAAKKKAEAEKKRKAEEVARKKAAAEKKAAEAQQREAEAALKAQLAEEESRARAQSALAEYIPYIQDKIQRNWLRPAGSPSGLTCLVKVRLIPGGDVVSVNVVRSSGDPVFDRSVETAVLKASPLPLPEDAELFNHFREINFNFDPGQ
jgi:colicin import membrane protein